MSDFLLWSGCGRLQAPHHMTKTLLSTFAIAVASCINTPIFAQDHIKISGLLYLDYSYVLASPLADDEGENGFGYRRLYVTTDYKISDDFSGRARFEANDGSTTAQGRPAPFVKDLYLKWSNSFANGHDLYIGISSPPSFTVAEKAWGYRSLEKTIQDRVKIVSSRDFGVALRGRLTSDGTVRYGVMVANNSGVSGESDKHKRIYAQAEFYPSEALTITIGGDYSSFGDDLDNGINGNGHIAYSAGNLTVGAEGFYNQVSPTGPGSSVDTYGVSLFARANLNENVTVIGRFDRVEFAEAGVEESENFFLAGLALRPHKNVEFIPNVLASKFESDDSSEVTGRVTLHMKF